MKKVKIITALLCAVLCAGSFAGCKTTNEDVYTSDGKLILNFAATADANTEDELYGYISDKFNISIDYTTMPYASWESSVNKMMNGGTMKDMVNWDFRPNKYSTYKDWAEGGLLKPLPSDLSEYPNVKAALENNPDIERFKVDGKIYCFPVVNSEDSHFISDIRYMYRRDWAKKLNLYKENDIYTLAEFEALMAGIYSSNPGGVSNVVALADVGWATPSIANYYTTELGSYSLDAQTNKYAFKFGTPEYTLALEKARGYYSSKYYWQDFYNYLATGRNLTLYRSGTVGITYDNFTLKNLVSLREQFRTANTAKPAYYTGTYNEWVSDATAPLYLVKEDGKFFAEELGYWWSVNLFSSKISDNKMANFLKLMDWYLSEEGLRFNAYGVKGQHWNEDASGNITFPVDQSLLRLNSKLLRTMVSVNRDSMLIDATVTESDRNDYKAVKNFYVDQKAAGKLTMNSLSKSNWLTGTFKDTYGGFSTEVTAAVASYIHSGTGWTDFLSKNMGNINGVLGEINAQI